MTEIFSLRGLPIFLSFFLWSVGTGANLLARPLFAASFGVPVLLVSLVTSANAVASLVAGPAAGFLMDRWGRKPLLVCGVLLRCLTAFAEFFAQDYVAYLLLEIVGALGVSTWVTGSSILVADLSRVENRGRAVATRNVSSRLGFVMGPFIGAAIATAFDLRAIFLFSAITKVFILAILLTLVAESRPQVAARPEHVGQPSGERLPWRIFATRSFVVISIIAFTISMMGQGVFQTLVPLSLRSDGHFSTAEIGSVLTIASLATLLVSVPNGLLVDRYGRKRTLVPGLAVLGLAALLMARADDYAAVVAMAIVYGIGDGMCFGASQAYAMDLAPEQRRGAFLGVWSLVSNAGAALAPLLVGFIAEQAGFSATFVAVAAVLFGIVGLAWGLAPEIRSKRIARVAAAT
jgi:MFS family permease